MIIITRVKKFFARDIIINKDMGLNIEFLINKLWIIIYFYEITLTEFRILLML